MSSFQLVNHQLKHMFGGIEAQKNSSLEYLETIQKKITKMMEKAQANHMKIYQAVATIKTSLTQLSENYLSISKENKHSSGLISKLTCEITDLLQDVSEQSLSLAKKMESKVQTYVPNLKKVKEKYTECAQTLEHYRKKVSLLKKNVERQSLANIKQDEHERFQRNKEKLRNAEKEYDQILMKTTKRYIEFNTEGMKDIENDLIAVFANVGANIMERCNNITKHLCQHFSAHQILLAKQLKIPRNGNQWMHLIEDQLRMTNHSQQDLRALNMEKRKAFFNYLTDERQVENYFKRIIEKEMVRQEGEKIHQIFKLKKPAAVPPKENANTETFNQFQNFYNNHELKHHHHSLLGNLKEEDPIEACQDLLEMEEGTEISRGFEKQDISRDNIEISPQLQKPKDNHFEDRMKANLQKFNKICEDNLIERNKSPSHNGVKPLDKAVSPNLKAIQAYKIQNNNYNSSKTVLKSPEEFFNLNYLQGQKKSENTIKAPQEELVRLHEKPFNFSIFEPAQSGNFSKQNHVKQAPEPNKINNLFGKSVSTTANHVKPTIQTGGLVSFDNFDIFVKGHNSPTGHKPALQPKMTINNQTVLNPKEKKLFSQGNTTDLLEL